MSNVAHTVDEFIVAVGATYRAIDIRSVAIRKEDSWVNVMAAVRLGRITHQQVELGSARPLTSDRAGADGRPQVGEI